MEKGGLQATFFYAFSWRAFEPPEEVPQKKYFRWERRDRAQPPCGEAASREARERHQTCLRSDRVEHHPDQLQKSGPCGRFFVTRCDEGLNRSRRFTNSSGANLNVGAERLRPRRGGGQDARSKSSHPPPTDTFPRKPKRMQFSNWRKPFRPLFGGLQYYFPIILAP
jgi:hypothetical protein